MSSPTVPEVTILEIPGPDLSHRVLFGEVRTESAVTAVVRRLRAAIGLGLLADGDRLPREADHVQQLGVTTFALREALGVLRDEGLITTRAGKNGGSFVSHGTDRAQLTSAELRRLSATELRDLGDWRAMLTSVSASLAARRRSPSNASRMREHATALATAENVRDARRAHGRFHIELAAAAQSTRMTQAEFQMYEEFDWLLGLALADDERRAASARELMDIATAVADGEPDLARTAADRHCASTVDALVKHRLASIASTFADAPREPTRSPETVDAALEGIISDVVEGLRRLAAHAAEALAGSLSAEEIEARLSRTAMSELLDRAVDLVGLAFIAEPSTIPGHPFWIAAWTATPNGVFADHRHVTDPSRDDFYDYPEHEWFAVPRRTGEVHAQGPYVDYGGVDEYVVTFTVPVRCGGRFVGVTAADVAVGAIERELSPWLASHPRTCVVVNAERRVLLSNSAEHIVGEVLRANSGLELAELSSVGWLVATSPAQDSSTRA